MAFADDLTIIAKTKNEGIEIARRIEEETKNSDSRSTKIKNNR